MSTKYKNISFICSLMINIYTCLTITKRTKNVSKFQETREVTHPKHQSSSGTGSHSLSNLNHFQFAYMAASSSSKFRPLLGGDSNLRFVETAGCLCLYFLAIISASENTLCRKTFFFFYKNESLIEKWVRFAKIKIQH